MNYKFHKTNSGNRKSLLCGCALVTMLVTASAVAATSSVQVQMGSNAPVGRILSLELAVNSVQLVSSKGVATTLVSRPFTLEQSHLVSSSEVVGRVNIPMGTYTKALLTVANPHVVFLDNFGNVREARWVGASLSTIILKQAISASAAPSVVRISLDIASLMKFDATQQIMLRTQPVFTVSQLSPGKAGADAEISGELEAAVGKVTAVSGSSFTVTDVISGLTTTFLTDRSTAFNGISIRTMLNLLVRVHSTTRSDSQLLAQDVSISGSGAGSIVTGVITDYSGTKAAAQQIYGAGASAALLGAFSTVAMDHAASFQVDSRGMDLTGLALTFGANNMVAGQRIQFINRTTMQNSANLGQALTVRLQLQNISGTVTNIAVASNGSTSFDLQLPANDGSPLTSLGEGASIVHIVSQPLTKSSGGNLSEGMQVRVRGLLMFDAPATATQSRIARAMVSTSQPTSDYYMVARQISSNKAGR
jgi:Domain of unknown function (DUF5666)